VAAAHKEVEKVGVVEVAVQVGARQDETAVSVDHHTVTSGLAVDSTREYRRLASVYPNASIHNSLPLSIHLSVALADKAIKMLPVFDASEWRVAVQARAQQAEGL